MRECDTKRVFPFQDSRYLAYVFIVSQKNCEDQVIRGSSKT